MIDIETYRRRIGGFQKNCHRKVKRKKDKRTDMTSERRSYSTYIPITLTLLLMVLLLSTSMWLPQDTRSGKNRQRGNFNSFDYTHKKEKESFNKLRSLNTQLIRCSSHLYFFEKCLEKNIYPINFEVKDHLQIAFKTPFLETSLQSINNSTVIEKMNICVSHYKLKKAEAFETITEEQARLKSLCTVDRFNLLKDRLRYFNNKLSKKLSQQKNKKLRKLLSNWQNNTRTNSNRSNEFWNSNLNLKLEAKEVILRNEDLDDSIINAALDLIRKQYPLFITQPPTLATVNGFVYCPFETIQIIHNNAHHWVLLSSFNSNINIYDSLNTIPTDSTLQQIKQLFSPDDSLPSYTLVTCHKQVGFSDCGVFAIAYAIDILNGNDPCKIIYDQSKMRAHLISCFESNYLTPFPKYQDNIMPQKTECVNLSKENSDWIIPRKSKRLQKKTLTNNTFVSYNKFYPLSEENNTPTTKPSKTTDESKNVNSDNFNSNENHNSFENSDQSNNFGKTKSKLSSIIFNISKTTLSTSEKSVLEKELNFCPSTPSLDKNRLLDDIFEFCRKIRLNEFFQRKKAKDENESTPDTSKILERTDMSTKLKNPFFNPPYSHSENLNLYLASIKNSITELCKKPFIFKHNITEDEQIALNNLKSRDNIVIQRADKGGKTVIMEKTDYVTECEKQLNNTEFYRKVDSSLIDKNNQLIKMNISRLKDQNYINEKEFKFLSTNFNSWRIPVFYGLPKIHKLFLSFPPLRPIVSGYNSISSNLSEYLDSYLKFQARLCKSFIRDTNDFLTKLKSIKNIPKNSIFVTMDVSSLYTNIDHEEGAQACYEKLETRLNKTVPSTTLKNLILLILKSNIFRFGNNFYHQIKGTAMGTPMAPNYANLFMDKFETSLLNDFFNKTGKKPFIWLRYIDDIFFIWTEGHESLQDFIQFCQKYSENNKMKSKIKFEVNLSTEKVHF